MSNFYSLEVVDSGSETHLQESGNLNYIYMVSDRLSIKVQYLTSSRRMTTSSFPHLIYHRYGERQVIIW